MLFLFQVHDMMDDIAEQQDVAKEISEAISNPVAFGGVSNYIYWQSLISFIYNHIYVYLL